MFLLRLPFLPLRVALFVARHLGYSRFGLFLIGIGIGLLLAPTTGKELRDRLREEIQARTGSGPAPLATSQP